MAEFKIVTDSLSDLPESYLKEHDVECMVLTCLIDGVEYNKDNKIGDKEFYDKIRAGALPTTSQINPAQAKETFEKIYKDYTRILYIGGSSGISGTVQSGNNAAREFEEDHPECKVIVVDSLCASLGVGLLVDFAVKLRDEGKNIEDAARELENLKGNIGHLFTVDDLFHLCRGGRVSKSAAVVGSVVGIKPLLHVDDEGKLVNIGKCRGRKKSLTSLVDMMEQRIGTYKEVDQKVFISHSDCLEDAKFVADEVHERFGFETQLINFIGPVIGSHTGVGTVALFFLTDKR